nr:integrase, catalytic region, zinc finger, CCHC-type, peptidase aspartic, catalytic [Tanacetum cinerariifolium]
NQSENDCLVVEKECDKEENPKVIAPGTFKLSVSQSVSIMSMLKTSCDFKNVEIKLKRKRRKRKSSKQNVKQVNNDVSRANSDFVYFSDLDTFSSVRRPKLSSVVWKKKGSSNTSNVGLSAVSISNLNKNVKRYSRNSHPGETNSASVCNDAMNVSCNSRMCDLLDDNNFFIFDDESVRISPVSKMPFRKKPRDSMNVRSKSLPKMKFEKDHLCSACEQGKIHRKHHKSIMAFPSNNPLYLLHMDLCGPMRVQSINGKQYVLVVVDDYSRTPQQNGVMERRNRTLVEAARTMLTFANLPSFLWAEAIATACFILNRLIIHKRFDKTPYELMNKRKPNIKFFRVFGCRCYLLNDYEDVGKLKTKGDIGVFVRYSKESAAFRIYNKRTRKIHESINVNFEEISEMASKQFSLEPGLSNLTKTGKSSNPSVSKVSEASKKDLEDLFQDFYEEYFDSSKIMKSSTTNVETSINEEVFHESISNNMSPNVDEVSTSHDVFNECLEDAYFDASTSFHDPSNVHTYYQPYPHEKKWTKDHLLYKIIGDPKLIVQTRGQLANSCLFSCLLSSIKPANVAKALKDADWTTFLNGILKEEVYVDQPPGFVSKQYPDHVYAIEKALYGLKQAPRAWYDVLSQFLIDSSFQKVPTPMVEQDKLKLDLVGKPVDHTDYRTESEYVAVSSCCAQVLWMRTQLTDYGFFYDKVPIYYDSKSAITISCNLGSANEIKGLCHVGLRHRVTWGVGGVFWYCSGEGTCTVAGCGGKGKKAGNSVELFKAWERYKLSFDRCPNHNMFPVTHIDTFYNGLTLRHRDTINAAAGGTFMKRRPEECYDLIENMTTHHNDWDTSAQRSESSSSITSSSDTEIASLKAEMAEINKNLMRVLQVNQQVKAVTLNCETCGGPHSFNDCPATVGQTQNVYAAGAYQVHEDEYRFIFGSGTLLGNTITNPKEELKGINTRSGTAYQGSTIPTTSSSIPPVVERETEATKDTVHPTNNESTKDVQPPVV